MPSLEGGEFRRILGHYPTGVCAITASDADGPVAMVVGTFTSVSLDPPLVAFLPDRRSTTWPRIEAAEHFCVNVLAERQEHVCRALSSRRDNKFDGIGYRVSETGLPVIDGVVAWIDCQLHAVHEAGDHFIAIGSVRSLAVERPDPPLVFLRGAYGGFSPCAYDELTGEWTPLTVGAPSV